MKKQIPYIAIRIMIQEVYGQVYHICYPATKKKTKFIL